MSNFAPYLQNQNFSYTNYIKEKNKLMRIGIIQMSDLHIMSADDFIVKNAVTVARSCKSIVNTCNKVVVVVSGDVIDRGKVANYDVAEKFFDDFKTELLKEAVLESYDYVFVPGNHDIDFDLDKQVRPVIIEKILNRDVVEEEMFVQICLRPQEAFWKFVSKMNGSPILPCVSYSKPIVVNDRCNLIFHCYNTALMSTINEQPQSLLVPENFFLYNTAIDDTRKDVVISVFHHKTGWLSTKTANNNQRTFEDHIENTSNILMCGHEHQKGIKVLSNLENVDKILYFESNSLQQGREQSFMVSVLDDETEKMTISLSEIFGIPDACNDMLCAKLPRRNAAHHIYFILFCSGDEQIRIRSSCFRERLRICGASFQTDHIHIIGNMLNCFRITVNHCNIMPLG